MNTFEKINIAILLVTVSYIIAISDLLSRVDPEEPMGEVSILRSVRPQRKNYCERRDVCAATLR